METTLLGCAPLFFFFFIHLINDAMSDNKFGMVTGSEVEEDVVSSNGQRLGRARRE
jgi:hypothetical protein